MKSSVLLFICCVVIWLGLNWPLTAGSLLSGVIVSIIVAALTGDMFVTRPHIAAHVRRYFWLAYYIVLLAVEVVKANIDIVFRVVHPDIPVNPGIVRVKTTIKSETGLTLLANSITCSTGTCTVDVDAGNGEVYVHWLDVKSQNTEAATELIVKKFEKVLQRIFD
ncbi:MAG: Na+/H+ antiporter subunit E [Candidatus Omnitrophica bacterium]|jgi:Multisubunit Na+/H+ antiporter, MnhE subunit|nr:Na+/H+ antiporter subunit E [Candidatus Omnitrophota bacterium]